MEPEHFPVVSSQDKSHYCLYHAQGQVSARKKVKAGQVESRGSAVCQSLVRRDCAMETPAGRASGAEGSAAVKAQRLELALSFPDRRESSRTVVTERVRGGELTGSQASDGLR